MSYLDTRPNSFRKDYTGPHSDVDKAFYLKDSRKNICDLRVDNLGNAEKNEFINTVKEQAKSVAALAYAGDLVRKKNGHYKVRKSIKTLSQTIPNLHENSKFKNEPTPAFGTAFLVGKKTVLTAAHCVYDKKLNALENDYRNYWVVFNLKMVSENEFPRVIPRNTVYKIQEVKSFSFDYSYDKDPEGKGNYKDWAILKLDRKVEDANPLEVDFRKVNYDPYNRQELYMLGYPTGLPMKFSHKGFVTENKYRVHPDDQKGKTICNNDHKDIFSTNLPAFQGNSGSPVFDKKTRKVVGILFRGQPDYKNVHNKVKVRKITQEEIDNNGYEKCQRINRIPFNKRVMALSERSIRFDLTNRNSHIFWKREKDYTARKIQRIYKREECTEKMAIATAVTGVILLPLAPILIPVGLGVAKTIDKKVDRASKELEDLEKGIKSVKRKFGDNSLNYNEAHLIKDHTPQNASQEDFRNLSIIAENMSAYDIPFEKAKKLRELDKLFEYKFSTQKILDLLKYEEEKMDGNHLSENPRRKILKYISTVQPDGSFISVEKARIKACIKITKKDPVYVGYNKDHIKAISKHYVKESPRLTFEQAREELGFPAPLNAGI